MRKCFAKWKFTTKGDTLLKLRKVEIVGFKSFCERTVVTFSGTGTTCIVGPNGCGKSNVVYAISWVLGEQSHKSLRAERMADCIFNGTTKRPPLGLAEVTLTMEDPELAEAARFVIEGSPTTDVSGTGPANLELPTTPPADADPSEPPAPSEPTDQPPAEGQAETPATPADSGSFGKKTMPTPYCPIAGRVRPCLPQTLRMKASLRACSTSPAR